MMLINYAFRAHPYNYYLSKEGKGYLVFAIVRTGRLESRYYLQTSLMDNPIHCQIKTFLSTAFKLRSLSTISLALTLS